MGCPHAHTLRLFLTPAILFGYIILLRSTKHADNIQLIIVQEVGDIDVQAEEAGSIAFDTAFNTTISVLPRNVRYDSVVLCAHCVLDCNLTQFGLVLFPSFLHFSFVHFCFSFFVSTVDFVHEKLSPFVVVA